MVGLRDLERKREEDVTTADIAYARSLCVPNEFEKKEVSCQVIALRVALLQALDALEARPTGDRRAIDRALCGAGDCDLPKGHPSSMPHRAPCGCINGCEVKECPNV